MHSIMPLTFNFYNLLQFTSQACFVDHNFYVGSGVSLFQAPLCAYAMFINEYSDLYSTFFVVTLLKKTNSFTTFL